MSFYSIGNMYEIMCQHHVRASPFLWPTRRDPHHWWMERKIPKHISTQVPPLSRNDLVSLFTSYTHLMPPSSCSRDLASYTLLAHGRLWSSSPHDTSVAVGSSVDRSVSPRPHGFEQKSHRFASRSYLRHIMHDNNKATDGRHRRATDPLRLYLRGYF